MNQLDRIQMMLGALLIAEGAIMAELDDLTVQVAQNVSVENSAVVLIQGIAAKLAAAIAAGNPAALVALHDSLNTSAAALAAAVTANTTP